MRALEVTGGLGPWSAGCVSAQEANWGGQEVPDKVSCLCLLYVDIRLVSLSLCQWLILQRGSLKQKEVVDGLGLLLAVHRAQGPNGSLQKYLPLLMVM